MSLRSWLFGSSEPEPERTEEDETRTLTHHYTVYTATMTYPNGDTERIEYTKGDFNSDEIIVYDHGADDYTASMSRYGSPSLRLNVDHGNPRRFSFANVRDMDIEREMDMVAVAEVEATVHYKGDEQVNINLKSGEDTPDVTVWHSSEWQAHQS